MKMRVIVALLSAAVAAILLPAATSAQVTEPEEDMEWFTEYYNNISLSGDPVVDRVEDAINYRWGFGSPDPAVDANQFSARWETVTDVPAGTYEVTVSTDDGMRVFVDGDRVLDAWERQSETTYDAFVTLDEGTHTITVEYFEYAGTAVAQFDWRLADPGDDDQDDTDDEWTAFYYDNTDLSGTPVAIDEVDVIDFDFGDSSPFPNLLPDNQWSALWIRTLELPEGEYEFEMTVDDGGRLYIDDDLIIDAWQNQPPTTYTEEVELDGDPVEVRMEYYENRVDAVARLDWEPVDIDETIEPVADEGLLVDNTNGGFTRGGAPGGWELEDGGYNETFYLSENTDIQANPYEWVRWYIDGFVDAEPGSYEVYVYIPQSTADLTESAPYWVHHFGGYTQTIVDQESNEG
ncbi:MAG: PA14 domain-containing protein [Anaerolineae bacterium]